MCFQLCEMMAYSVVLHDVTAIPSAVGWVVEAAASNHIGHDKSNQQRASSKWALFQTKRSPEHLLLGSPDTSSNTRVSCLFLSHYVPLVLGMILFLAQPSHRCQESDRPTQIQSAERVIQTGVVPNESQPRAFVARKSGHIKQCLCLLFVLESLCSPRVRRDCIFRAACCFAWHQV